MEKVGTNPSIYRVGILPDGRNLYRIVTSHGPAYCASDEIITIWDEGTWWTDEQEAVRRWLKEMRRG